VFSFKKLVHWGEAGFFKILRGQDEVSLIFVKYLIISVELKKKLTLVSQSNDSLYQ
jgi:hypothetical protein